MRGSGESERQSLCISHPQMKFVWHPFLICFEEKCRLSYSGRFHSTSPELQWHLKQGQVFIHFRYVNLFIMTGLQGHGMYSSLDVYSVSDLCIDSILFFYQFFLQCKPQQLKQVLCACFFHDLLPETVNGSYTYI